MARRMKGQFYVVAGFMMAAYIYFLIQLFTSVQTNAEVPRIATGDDVKEVLQNLVDEGPEGTAGKIENLENALSLRTESVYLLCSSFGDQTERCSLDFPHWACGVNVTVTTNTHGKGRVELKEFVASAHDFWRNESRVGVFIDGNTSGSLLKITVSSPFRGTVYDGRRLIKGSWSGNTVTFRYNVKKDPVYVHIYNVSSKSYNLFENISVLNDGSYDSAILYSKLESYGAENITFAELEELDGNKGPSILFIPSTGYPVSYGSELEDYVKYGGVLVCPYGLCNKSTETCMVGDIYTETGSTGLQGIGDWASFEDTDSNYYTTMASAWMVFNSTSGYNQSSVGLGPVPYEEGWVVFVGNETMLSGWSMLDQFLDELVNWAMPPNSITKTACPVQNA